MDTDVMDTKEALFEMKCEDCGMTVCIIFLQYCITHKKILCPWCGEEDHYNCEVVPL